jgi:hypothetical protein
MAIVLVKIKTAVIGRERDRGGSETEMNVEYNVGLMEIDLNKRWERCHSSSDHSYRSYRL